MVSPRILALLVAFTSLACGAEDRDSSSGVRPPRDAGPGADASTVEPDAGSVRPDAGTTSLDATVPSDAGAGREDTNALCSDGVSNDGDRFIDCDDFDCSRNAAVTVCQPANGALEASFERCTNGRDDDGNGFTDGDDFGCCQIVSPSVCPTRCGGSTETLAVNGTKAAVTIAAAFTERAPGMWQTAIADSSLVFSDWSYRERARQFAVRFVLPPIPGSALVTKLTVVVDAPAATRWNAILVDEAFAGRACGEGAVAFGLSGSEDRARQTFVFDQPGFPYPDLYQPGSDVTLIVTQVAETTRDVSALPDTATIDVTYER
jgi:hypothetical protein